MATDISTKSEADDREISDDVLYEIVDGDKVGLPPMGTEQELTAAIILGRLSYYADTTKRGRATMETLFDFTEQLGRKRRPDVAYVSIDRWPRTKPVGKQDGWPVAPNLAVEVISPSNSWDDVLDRIHEYFQVGVQRIWVVSTSRKQVHVYTSPTDVRILSHDQDLNDEELLPSFSLPLSDVFEVVA